MPSSRKINDPSFCRRPLRVSGMPICRETRALNADTPKNRHHENPPRFISRLLAALLEQWRMHYARSRVYDKRETQPSPPHEFTGPYARPLASTIETHMPVSGHSARAASYVRDPNARNECLVKTSTGGTYQLDKATYDGGREVEISADSGFLHCLDV